MRAALLPALLLLAACPKKDRDTTPVDNAAAVARPALVPCPADLEAIARTAWEVEAGTVTAQCTALVAGGQARWYLEGYVEVEGDDGFAVQAHQALLLAGGREVTWKQAQTDLPPSVMERDASGRPEPVDLDGDGSDELVQQVGWSHGGHEERSVVVISIVDSQVRIGPAMPLTTDNSAAVDDGDAAITCTGEFGVIPGPEGTRRIVLTGPEEGDGETCARPGRHVYSWDGRSLVEVPE